MAQPVPDFSKGLGYLMEKDLWCSAAAHLPPPLQYTKVLRHERMGGNVSGAVSH